MAYKTDSDRYFVGYRHVKGKMMGAELDLDDVASQIQTAVAELAALRGLLTELLTQLALLDAMSERPVTLCEVVIKKCVRTHTTGCAVDPLTAYDKPRKER